MLRASGICIVRVRFTVRVWITARVRVRVRVRAGIGGRGCVRRTVRGWN